MEHKGGNNMVSKWKKKSEAIEKMKTWRDEYPILKDLHRMKRIKGTDNIVLLTPQNYNRIVDVLTLTNKRIKTLENILSMRDVKKFRAIMRGA